jgi:hypothetical protein
MRCRIKREVGFVTRKNGDGALEEKMGYELSFEF